VPIVDLPLKELGSYKPALTRTKQFTKFWDENLAQSAEQRLNPKPTDIHYFTDKVRVTKVSFDGFHDKSPITGLFIKPSGTKGKAPTLVVYHGYSINKGPVTDYLGWAFLGFNVFAVDVRGQLGESMDYARYGPGYATGHMTKGILDENSYYYRYVFMDCCRAVDYVLGRDDVDGSRVGVAGISQGGGLSIATAGLHKRVSLLISSVPFLCNFERAMNVATAGPYLEILNYLKWRPDDEKRALETLSYFDAMNLAPNVKAPSFVSVGLVDIICPPSSVYATFNHLAAKKELAVYPGTGHEETTINVERKMKWAATHLLD
jgi:cephalosporin-C deacetylase